MKFTKLALIIGFALALAAAAPGLSSLAVAEDPYNTGIQWDPVEERIAGEKYQLPKGWKEAVKGVKEIRVFNWSAVLPWDIATQMTADAFTRNTGIKVKWLIPPNPQMIAKQMNMMIAKSDAADILVLLENSHGTFRDAGWLSPINFLYPEDVWKHYPPDMRKVITDKKGDVYAVPNIMKVFVLNYRKEMFQAAGITKVPETWDELIEAGKKLTIDKDGDGNPDQWGLIYMGGGANDELFLLIESLVYQQGGDFVDESGKINVKTPEIARAVQLLSDFRNKHKIVPPGISKLAYMDMVDVFSKGNVAMAIFGFELTTQPAVYDVLKEELGQALLPGPTADKKGITQAQYELASLSPFSKNKAAALLYLDLRRSRQSGRYELVNERNAGWFLDVYDEPGVQQKVPNFEALKQATALGKCPTFKGIDETRKILNMEAINVILGQKNVEQALEDAQVGIESLMKK